jgi:hypothetical protein
LDEQIFDRGGSRFPPCLRSDRLNRILLYPGASNPPHHNHLAILRHGSEYNVIAATVIPIDDVALEKKCIAQGLFMNDPSQTANRFSPNV